MIISRRDPLRIVGTIVARDEEDIIGPMIEHHLAQGITHILFTDNSSKDRTVEIASKYKEVREITVSDDMTHNQEMHTTRMAKLACLFDPDWVVHLDADEFWCGFDQLNNYTKEKALWTTRAYVHPPVPGGSFKLERQHHYIDFRGMAREFKVIHRPDPDIIVKHGNHHVEGVSCGVTNVLYRHHYPIRSFSQFEKKVVQGGNALKSRNFVCERWQKWLEYHEQGTLREQYDYLINGWLSMIQKKVIDPTVMKELLVRCYGVQPELAEETFDTLAQAGMKPQIRSWLPRACKADWTSPLI